MFWTEGRLKIDHTPEAIIVAVRLNNALETARLVDRPHRHNTHLTRMWAAGIITTSKHVMTSSRKRH